MTSFLKELSVLTEATAKNTVFKLEIPSEAKALLALKKDKQMEAIEGEEEGDGSFIQNQSVVTVEYVTRVGNKIHVYPMMDGFDTSKVSKIAERLQKAFNTWCLKFKAPKIQESVNLTEERQHVAELGSVLGEVGENIDNSLAALNLEFESIAAAVESKYEMYLGEDLRELKQFLKSAKRVAVKLNDALMDIPLEEAAKTAGPRFRISWKGYGKTAPKVVGLEFFSDGNGFSDSDIKEISSMSVGEDWVDGGPMDSVTVTRIK